MAMSVVEFVRQKVPPQHRGTVAMIRQLMRDTAPGAKEIIAYDTLGWKKRGIIAVINPTKKYVTFVFLRGAEFEDKYGLLQGGGKKRKLLKVTKSDVSMTELRYYIKQAIKRDEK